MNPGVSDRAVLQLLRLLAQVRGRTRLQRIVYLLQAKGFEAFSQEFFLQVYGPFSGDLAEQVDRLCDADLVSQQEDGGAYVYRPTDRLGAPATGACVPDGSPDWASFAAMLNNRSTAFLEALATVVYLSQGGPSPHSLVRSFQRAKPQLASEYDQALRAAHEFEFLPMALGA